MTDGPPAVYVVGVGASSSATAEEVAGLVQANLDALGVQVAQVALVATTEVLAADHRVLQLGRPVKGFALDRLAGVAVPNPSEVPARALGTTSVAEAAALLAAGAGGRLVLEKQRSPHATVAIALADDRATAGRPEGGV